VYISVSLKWKRRCDFEHEQLECIWIEIFPDKAESWLDRPPETSSYLPNNFNEFFNNMLKTASSRNIHDNILMGDINVNFLNKNNNTIKSILALHRLKQLVTKATTVKWSFH